MSEGIVVTIVTAMLKSYVTWAIAGVSTFLAGIYYFFRRQQRIIYKIQRDRARHDAWLLREEHKANEKMSDDIDPFATLD